MRSHSTAESVQSLVNSATVSGGVSPTADTPRNEVEAEKLARIERYSSAEFARQLLNHFHEAKKAAILESKGQAGT